MFEGHRLLFVDLHLAGRWGENYDNALEKPFHLVRIENPVTKEVVGEECSFTGERSAFYLVEGVNCMGYTVEEYRIVEPRFQISICRYLVCEENTKVIIDEISGWCKGWRLKPFTEGLVSLLRRHDENAADDPVAIPYIKNLAKTCDPSVILSMN